MQTITKIVCLECQHIQTAGLDVSAVCPKCGSPWLNAHYDYEATQAIWKQGLSNRESSLWRYAELLPVVPQDQTISMGEGFTPLTRLYAYESLYDHSEIYIKDERTNPTNSFKDRQAAVSITALKQQGVKEIALASTGNAGVAYAAFCARAGIKLWLFLTSLVPAEKMREAAIYGCEVIRVSGTYDETKKIASEFASRKGIYFDRGAKSIPGKESMKTIAFEIAEQLGMADAYQTGKPWQAPDWYIQAVSGGIGPLGVWKGFRELRQMRLIDKMPKLGIIQSAGCAPMVQAFERDKETATPVIPKTLITVLATGDPGYSYMQLREACLGNGGTMIAIEDGEIFRAMRNVASRAGLSVEPATAVAFAGLEKMLQNRTIKPDEKIVVNCSGHTFPAESHILGDQFGQYVPELQLPQNSFPTVTVNAPIDSINAAIKNLDEQITTIVIIDDNLDDRRLLKRLLRSHKQYRLFEARDGNEAITVINERKPDLIISDLRMPEMDGFGLIERLKQAPETANIPIIVVSAKELSNEDLVALQKHTESIWNKGRFDTGELVDHVVDILGHQPIGILHKRANPEASESEIITQIKPEPEYKHTIVIIDDNANDRRLARKFIQSGENNYDIIDVSDGREGLKAIYNHHPDLVVLDWILPDIDGASVIEYLQRDPILKDIPVIIYSAHDLTETERAKLKHKIQTIVHKTSTDRKQFLSTIEDELQ